MTVVETITNLNNLSMYSSNELELLRKSKLTNLEISHEGYKRTIPLSTRLTSEKLQQLKMNIEKLLEESLDNVNKELDSYIISKKL